MCPEEAPSYLIVRCKEFIGDNSDIFIQLVLFSGIILFYSLFSLFEHLSAALVGEKEGGTDGQ